MPIKSERSRMLRSLLALFAIALISGIILSNLISPTFAQTPLAGGKTTVFNRTSKAYEQPSVGLNEIESERHFEGDLAFDAVFVTPPARINPGLGPLFNNASCTGCHIRNGRGLPEKGQLLVRVSESRQNSGETTSNRQPVISTYHPEASVSLGNAPPVEGLGTQIQDQGVYGYKPEATVAIAWEEQEGEYGDGTSYSLRSPHPQIILANGKPISPAILTSLRIPPPVFGLGLIEAIPEKTIRDLADPDDRDRNGISGRPNQVWDVEKEAIVLGRFGWKANNPNLLQQTASAYINDMGVTNPLFPESDEKPDIDRKTLENAEFYAQSLAVPGRILLDDAEVKQGEKLFQQANCASCHIPTLSTGNYKIEALAQQTIHPYTDLLLHDMGEGLADGRPDFLATGREWRTQSLWGIGLTQTVLPYSSYLHDGRARTLEEAILWHSGEAENSKEQFRKMSQGDRAALVRFLRSL
ncbi:di-heme oxidoredictase family protein [Spirulina sp. 06S082]|uniref:di-heme oxidoreductase family protein n=1 Tax=Spirulina sp. 06S082 TaxID=3110248 RepID=UPI002B21191D|nr:di-heme oxidoredictase family protein [Spirulina sp. 06S082]MEA5471085.1 di-heme oxidoredictase family protein [Spirulina sp. 06S082]